MIVLQIKKAKKMKKLVLMFVAIAAISFASCTEQKANNDVQNADSTVVADSAADSVATPADTVAADSAK
ncbi:MAG: hypothetical protein IKZ61_08390 [Prevotella sp.]|nr:hypothetical protein [Prevotella sp.]